MSDISGPEQPITLETQITPEAQGELKVLGAIIDQIGNIISGPVGYAELRRMGRPNLPTAEQDLTDLLDRLQNLNQNVGAATVRLSKGESLPEIEEVPGQPIIDLKYTDYTDLSKPPVTTKPNISSK